MKKRPVTQGKAMAAMGLALVLALPTAAAASGSPDPAGPTTPRAERATASLSATPQSKFVGGQAMVLKGRLAKKGKRKIWLEFNGHRGGEKWGQIYGSPYTGKTRADGSFALKVHAPDMAGMSWRIHGAKGGGATPEITFDPLSQDVEMWTVDPMDDSPMDPVAGMPFAVLADTTPQLFRRPDTIGLPVFTGRKLTLQRRVSPTTWETISTTTADSDGIGVFPTLTETAGEYVYRVRMERLTTNGHSIGWTATFPTYVEVAVPRSGPVPTAPRVEQVATLGVARPAAARATVTGTAAEVFGWYPIRWSYDWTRGQDLESRPDKGSSPGKWLQYSDGTGRVSKHNGQLGLDSGRQVKSGLGDWGTTRATLVKDGQPYGRWEARLRAKANEAAGKDYDVAVELVPTNAADFACGRRNITVARYTGTGSQMTFGVNAMSSRWTKTITTEAIDKAIPAVAVEVGKTHITWFVDGQVVGVVKSKAAVSGVPMTLRLSLIGESGEYANTSVLSDWQRSFPIGNGRQITQGPSLTKKSLGSCVE